MQALSDMCVLLILVRLNADDAVTRLPSVEVGFGVEECGQAARGVSRAEALIRQSVIPSGSNPVTIICK